MTNRPSSLRTRTTSTFPRSALVYEHGGPYVEFTASDNQSITALATDMVKARKLLNVMGLRAEYHGVTLTATTFTSPQDIIDQFENART